MASERPVSPRSLDDTHYEVLSRALLNVLGTDLAVNFYAEIVDGLPTEDTAWDQYSNNHDRIHPVNQHKELCLGALDKAKEFREKFTIDDLKFKPELIKAYNATPVSSKTFHLRLIELTASALHQIGVYLYQKTDKIHDSETTGGLSVDEVMRWERPTDGWPRIPAEPTLFIHSQFTAHEQYPNGIADIVGYWVEDRVLGGVPLFDHSQVWKDEDEPNVYFQSCRRSTTFRVWQLLDEQQADLASFLLRDDNESGSATGPLPILPSRANTVRVDPDDAIPVHNIYRDLYERRPPREQLRMMEGRGSCHRNSRDDPQMDDESLEEKIARYNRM